jgi:hypothetical protein
MAHVKMPPALSDKDLKRHNHDLMLVQRLLRCAARSDQNGVPHLVFLPEDIEKDAYAALCRVLNRISEYLDSDYFFVLTELARAFHPKGRSRMRAFLKGRTTADRKTALHPARNYEIAREVDRLRRHEGLPYKKATQKVGLAHNRSQAHIERIYGEYIDGFARIPRKRKSSK